MLRDASGGFRKGFRSFCPLGVLRRQRLKQLRRGILAPLCGLAFERPSWDSSYNQPLADLAEVQEIDDECHS